MILKIELSANEGYPVKAHSSGGVGRRGRGQWYIRRRHRGRRHGQRRGGRRGEQLELPRSGAKSLRVGILQRDISQAQIEWQQSAAVIQFCSRLETTQLLLFLRFVGQQKARDVERSLGLDGQRGLLTRG